MAVAVIGAGLAGLTCALRLAEQGCDTDVYEASPYAGGRTRSFYDSHLHTWVDNGPHLLIGAYAQTRALLHDIGAHDHVSWQPSLYLPLWDNKRGLFSFSPTPYLPLPLVLPVAAMRMPGHGPASALAIIRLARAIPRLGNEKISIERWFDGLDVPVPLRRDLLNPLCLAAMNEAPQTANALSFARVLREAFSSQFSARLGWFDAPLSQALVEPLLKRLMALGVRVFTRRRVCRIYPQGGDISVCFTRAEAKRYTRVVVTTPAYISNGLLGCAEPVATQTITNVHLWFEQRLQLPAAVVGGIGTHGQWFFDVSQQMQQKSGPAHLCAVISADNADTEASVRIRQLCRELSAILEKPLSKPVQVRLVRIRHATVQVRRYPHIPPARGIIDASERPQPGDLPATIEYAVDRGQQAAERILADLLE